MLGEPMEPDIMPLYSSSPPPLDDDGDVEAGSEEDEFGDFGGFSVGVSCFADSSSSLRQSCPTTKPATPRPNCSFNHPVKPTSTVDLGSDRDQIYLEEQDCNVESCVHLTNGYSEKDHKSGTHITSAVGACSPREETGFADFTVFTEQITHPWCCGFSPMVTQEQWNGRGEGTNSSNSLVEQIFDPRQEVVMDSEPRSHCACKAKVCTKIKHCEKRDATLVQPSQDHHQPQEAAATLDFPPEELYSGEEFGKSGDSQRERWKGFNPLQTTEVQEAGESDEDREDREKSIPQTFSVHEFASEDMASFCDDSSFECPSTDLEPNVSSLVSQEDQTDWDQTDDDEEEAMGNYRHSDSQSKAEKSFCYCNHSATQETSATSNQSQPGTHTEDTFSDFKDCSVEHHKGRGYVQTADEAVRNLGNLPPSDSFADFCSAPAQDDGEASWAEFKDQRVQEEEKSWTQFREPVSSLQTNGDTEEEQDRAGQYEVSRRDSCQASLSCRVQQLLMASFPEVDVPTVESEEEVLSLGVLLHDRHHPDSKEEAIPDLCPRTQWIRRWVWWPHQDLHDAVGLQFQWGGSHTNRTLLRCLGVETTDIGMLEPTKDSVSAVRPPGPTEAIPQAPPGPRDTQVPSTHLVQEALPSSQLDWSSRGLSSSQDGTSPRRAPLFWGWK